MRINNPEDDQTVSIFQPPISFPQLSLPSVLEPGHRGIVTVWTTGDTGGEAETTGSYHVSRSLDGACSVARRIIPQRDIWDSLCSHVHADILSLLCPTAENTMKSLTIAQIKI